MVFSSLLFISVFLPVFLLCYFVSPTKYRNLILFIFSLIFYAWGEPVYIFIMLFSTLLDFINGLMMQRYENKDGIRKVFLLISIFVNLGMLFFFKYSDLVISKVNSAFGLSVQAFGLPLPIGISFYTFQTMSYSIDVYRRKVSTQHNIISFGAYVAMFPQLVAGPIVRYIDIEKELANRAVNFDKFALGIKRFTVGLCKKVLLANNIGLLWNKYKNLSQISLLGAWLGIISFAFQLYFDFSGYSDMAIGLGKMLGFDFPENFNYPYTAKNVSDFWRRWHMTLTAWFREYLYIPLGGNRVSTARNILNIMIVWIATGIWHGASYNFLLWGLYFGIILLIEKFALKNIIAKLPAILKHFYTITVVLVGWVIFEFESITAITNYIKAMFGVNITGFCDNTTLYYLSENVILLPLLAILSTPLLKKIAFRLNSTVTTVLCCIGLLLSLSYIVSSSYNPFLYFRF